MATSKQLARTPAQGTPQEAARQPPGPRTRLPVLLFLGSIIVSFLAASSAPTPLYAVYAAHWGFSPLATTVVFGVYALAVLAALLAFGRISDHIGRRPVLLTGLVLQAVAMVVFATAGDLGTLLAARVVQGLAAGSSLGAVGAAMLDLDQRRGALANSFAPGVGTGTGALLSALAAQRRGHRLAEMDADSRGRVGAERQAVIGERQPRAAGGPPSVMPGDVRLVDVGERGRKPQETEGRLKGSLVGHGHAVPAWPQAERQPERREPPVHGEGEKFSHVTDPTGAPTR